MSSSDMDVTVNEVAFVTNEIYKALSGRVGTKNSAKNEQHDEDEKNVRRHVKKLSAIVETYKCQPTFDFVKWTSIASPAMPEEDDQAATP